MSREEKNLKTNVSVWLKGINSFVTKRDFAYIDDGSAYGMNCNFKQRFRSGTRELLGWQTTFNNLSICSLFLPRRGYIEFQKKTLVDGIQLHFILVYENFWTAAIPFLYVFHSFSAIAKIIDFS